MATRSGTREARNRDGSSNPVLDPAVFWRFTEAGRAAPESAAWRNPYAARYRRDSVPSGP